MFYECLYVYNFSYLTLEEGILCTLTFSSIIVQIPCEQNELIVILGLFFIIGISYSDNTGLFVEEGTLKVIRCVLIVIFYLHVILRS